MGSFFSLTTVKVRDMSIYNYLSKETLNYINDLLLDTSGSNKTTLMQIRNYLNKHHSRIRKK